jgi:4,5-DOPA dioxygenase extradiol
MALEPGDAGAALVDKAGTLPRPKAIVVASAHWDTQVPTLSVACKLETIHDFHGFPQPLYAMRYAAPGAVPLAMDVRVLLEEAGFKVELDCSRGLDHGAWVPLRLMYPEADIPVLGMSIQSHLGPRHHYQVGQALAALRQQGVLVIASGNLTHNLMHFATMRGLDHPPEYVTAFQNWMFAQLQAGDIDTLLDYRQMAPGAVDAHPSEEHLLPLFLALGAAGPDFSAERIYSGIEYKMLAMDSYAFQPKHSIET